MLSHVSVWLKLMNIWAAVGGPVGTFWWRWASSQLTRQNKSISFLPDSTCWAWSVPLCSCWCHVREGLEACGWWQMKRSGTPRIWAEIGLSCCETAPMAFQVLLNHLVVAVLRSLAIKWWLRSSFLLSVCNFWDNTSSSKIILNVLSTIPLVSSWSPRHILTVCLLTCIWNDDYIWRTWAYSENLPAENISKFKIEIIFF